MRIYLDACCLNRPFDDQLQERIRLESEAILLIMKRLHSREWYWLESDVLTTELARIPDPQRRERVLSLASYVHKSIPLRKLMKNVLTGSRRLALGLWMRYI